MSLQAELDEVTRQLDETMALTFRARGAKLEALTAKLEHLESEQRRLEAALGSASLTVAQPKTAAAAVQMSSPMPQRPPPVLSAPQTVPTKRSISGCANSPNASPYASLNQSVPSPAVPRVAVAATAAPAPVAVVSPVKPVAPPAVIAHRPPLADIKARLMEKKAALQARLASAAAGISQLEGLKGFLDRKESEMAARAANVSERESMLHYVLHVDKVINVQRKIRKWRARKSNSSGVTATMLYKAVQDYKKSDVAKEAKHRWQALVEIYNSEKAYLASLELLIKHYMRPIEAASQQENSCLQPAEALVIFSTLDVIVAYSSKMVENLAYATVSVKKSEKMGDVFLQMVPTMALYERYFLGFDDSLETLKRLGKNKRFVDLLAQCRKASGSQLTLEQLLIMPVQRLPRYAILLEALIKHTAESHTDRPALLEAQKQVKMVLSGINSKAKERETVGAVAKIAQKVSGFPPTFQLATSARRFLLADLMIFVVAGRIVTRRKPMHLFLFNDLILRTKPKRGVDDAFFFREAIPLTSAVVLEDLPNDKNVTSGFAVKSPEKTWIFMADVPIKKDSWMEAIAGVLKALQTPSSPDAPRVDVAAVPVAAPAASAAGSQKLVSAAAVSSARIWDSIERLLAAWPADEAAVPPVFVAVKGNSYEYGGPGGEASVDVVFDEELRSPFYQKYLKFRPHSIYAGVLPGGKSPVLVIVERTEESKGAFGMLCTAEEDYRFTFHGGAKEVEAAIAKRLNVVVHLRALIRVSSDSSIASVVTAKLAEFETAQIVSTYKIGVLEWHSGQSEDEAFANPMSSGMERFLSLIGERVLLKGWAKFRGGLNVQNDETGRESVFAERNGFQVMFHVAPLLPGNAHDKQQLERKRHLGNDVVVIILREPGSKPLDVTSLRSQFNHVFIVVAAVSDDKFRVSVCAKPGVPFFCPRLPPSGILSARELGPFLLAKAVNGERAAMHAKDFRVLATTTRANQLLELVDLAGDGKSQSSERTGSKKREAVDPNDPRELGRRLEELKAREKKTETSLDGLTKLAKFYTKDAKARAETAEKLAELEAERAELQRQIAVIDAKLRNSASDTVAKVTLASKSESERQALLARFRSEAEKQQKTVASLEKLLGFYAKDPSGAATTKAQLDLERTSLESLRKRVQELESSLAGSSAVAGAEGEDEEEEEGEEDDGLDVDALSKALRGITGRRSTAAAAAASPTAAETAHPEPVAVAGKSSEDEEKDAVAGTMTRNYEHHVAGDRVWILHESPDFLYVSGPRGEGYVPTDHVERDDRGGSAATEEEAAVAATVAADYAPFAAGDRVWVLSEDGEFSYVSGERGEGYIEARLLTPDT